MRARNRKEGPLDAGRRGASPEIEDERQLVPLGCPGAPGTPRPRAPRVCTQTPVSPGLLMQEGFLHQKSRGG